MPAIAQAEAETYHAVLVVTAAASSLADGPLAGSISSSPKSTAAVGSTLAASTRWKGQVARECSRVYEMLRLETMIGYLLALVSAFRDAVVSEAS